MRKIIINGGKPLCGSVKVGGSKNAALPILFAALATEGISEIKRVPRIGDIEVTLGILEELGVKISEGENSLILDTRRLCYKTPKKEKVKKIRASTYLLGACLSRFGECDILDFGGCNFSLRPIDLHLKAAESLGARISDKRITARELCGAEIILEKPSVGATVNSLIMAATAKGKTVIKGYAKEPHVLGLIDYLVSCGAQISLSEGEITVYGKKLHGGKSEVIGDMIEAGTYLTAAIITGGEIEVRGISRDQMQSYINLISPAGAELKMTDNAISAKGKDELRKMNVKAEPYPGFPTDLQPIIAPLLAANGGGVIEDTVFPERFGYLEILSHFGVEYSRTDNTAKIFKSKFKPANVDAPCLRGGAACLLSALRAEGRSEINCAEIILRGYEDPIGKLKAVGADIELL